MMRVLIFWLFFSLTSFAKEPLRLLVLEAQSFPPYGAVTDTVLSELFKQGFRVGKNLVVERHVLGNYEGRGLTVLNSFADSGFTVIFLNGTISGISAKQFMEHIPSEKARNFQFVFANVTDPVGIGLVQKMDAPTTGNFTGIAYPVKVQDRLRLVQKYFGRNVKVGYIYSEMPQSISYKGWLDEQLKKSEFRDMEFHFRQVPFVRSDGGIVRMSILAQEFMRELDTIVDVFLSPNDQMGSSREFSTRVLRTCNKPLFGLADEEGSAVALTPDLDQVGKDIADMILGIYNGKEAKDFVPHFPSAKVYRNPEIPLTNIPY